MEKQRKEMKKEMKKSTDAIKLSKEMMAQAGFTKEDKAKVEFGAGTMKAGSGQYQEAIIHFEKAIELNPNSAEAYNNWGFALNELKQYEEAIEKYKKAIELNPNNVNAYNNWGVALNELEKTDEAIEKYKKATELATEQGLIDIVKRIEENIAIAKSTRNKL